MELTEKTGLQVSFFVTCIVLAVLTLVLGAAVWHLNQGCRKETDSTPSRLFSTTEEGRVLGAGSDTPILARLDDGRMVARCPNGYRGVIRVQGPGNDLLQEEMVCEASM